MIKTYTDTTMIQSNTLPLLFDLCYINTISVLKLIQNRWWYKWGDIVIVPVDIAYFFWKWQSQWLYDFIAKGNASNKLVWVYSAGDIVIA
jgi:hypothetical protein